MKLFKTILSKSICIFRVSLVQFRPIDAYLCEGILRSFLSMRYQTPIDSLMPSLCQAQQFIGHSRLRDGLL